MNNEWDFEPRKPFWRCEECGYEDHIKPLPKDRDKWISQQKAGKCPKCRSEALMPVGW